MVDARRAVVQLFVAAVLGGAVAGIVSACFIWTVERGVELVWVDLPERLDLAPFDSWWLVAVPVIGGVLVGLGQRFIGDLPMPIVTGQDAELPSVKSIIAGEQYSTVFKDTRELAKVAVGMADALLQGGEPEINDTTTYDNGVKVVPSYLLEPVSVDVTNYEEIVIGSGYHKAEDLN